MVTRRGFLKGGGMALFGIGLLGGIPAFIAEAAAREKVTRLYKKGKVLVCIFQRGAMDGLMAVTPFSDPYLQAARPTLFMTPAKGGTAAPLIDLDGRFGLHPALQAFEPLFRDKRLAIVHGIGSPNNTRSHFDAQDYMESGTPFDKATPSPYALFGGQPVFCHAPLAIRRQSGSGDQQPPGFCHRDEGKPIGRQYGRQEL
jgi:uncharacterized protein (DUF1501 family)